MKESKKEKNRNFILVNTANQIHAILQQHIGKTELAIKEKPYPKVKILQLTENNSLLAEAGAVLTKDKELVLFKVMARYIEVHCHVVKVVNEKVSLLQVDKILIAENSRKFKRFSVASQQAYITNVKIPKVDLEMDFFTVPTVVTVSFSSFEKTLKGYADFVKIKAVSRDDNFERALIKSLKPLWVSDTSDALTYKPDDENLFDYAGFLGDNLQKTINSNRARGIRSLLYMPVLTERKNNTPNVLGFIQLTSYSRFLLREDLEKMKKKAEELVYKIRESNSTAIKQKQFLVDMSVQGMAVEISDLELQRALPQQTGFFFDLIIRERPAVNLFANIISIEEKSSGIMVMGLQLPETSNLSESLKVYHMNLRDHVEKLAEEKGKRS